MSKERVKFLEEKVRELNEVLEILKNEAFSKGLDGKYILQDKKSFRLYLDTLSVLISLEKEIRGYKDLMLKEGKTEETDTILKEEKQKLDELRNLLENSIEASKENGKN
jgi:hypothetical protein